MKLDIGRKSSDFILDNDGGNAEADDEGEGDELWLLALLGVNHHLFKAAFALTLAFAVCVSSVYQVEGHWIRWRMECALRPPSDYPTLSPPNLHRLMRVGAQREREIYWQTLVAQLVALDSVHQHRETLITVRESAESAAVVIVSHQSSCVSPPSPQLRIELRLVLLVQLVPARA